MVCVGVEGWDGGMGGGGVGVGRQRLVELLVVVVGGWLVGEGGRGREGGGGQCNGKAPCSDAAREAWVFDG